MASSPGALPLDEHRANVARYLRGLDFSFEAVAGRIIAERLPLHAARDPVRPSLVLWACAANDSDVADALPVAAAFALFDRFMLLHAELSDKTAPTVARWGLGQSLNAGDALFALAFRTLASDVRHPQRRLQAARLVGEAVLEAIELPDDGVAAHGVLTGAALHAGAVVGGADERIAQTFARAGGLIGKSAAAGDAALAEKFGRRAIAALRDHTAPEHLRAFEEVAVYVAQRAA
ncbi:MAG TPA: hypothetical protein VMT95_05170 [Candidatus Binatia bacterium]|nr:hypothetical protein [Candidatus Binatia bacterium]